ncbi:MAG: DUF484 family protein [Rhodobacter sp.]|nr:DUF484 family protein [Rhodobacter sp.]
MFADAGPDPGPSDTPGDRSTITQDLRDVILSSPEAVLQDHAVMAALVAAGDRALGSNVVDLRGMAMDRMEARLGRLEDTHRSVIAAVYDNLAGTNQVHRATLQLLTPGTFEVFLQVLGSDVAQTLRVDCARLVLESRQTPQDPGLQRPGSPLCVTAPGFVDAYLGTGPGAPPRPVTLRQRPAGSDLPYGAQADAILSEALLRLDFGEGRLPGLLALGAGDPCRFRAAQGTDLLGFFGGVVERAMRRWLS